MSYNDTEKEIDEKLEEKYRTKLEGSINTYNEIIQNPKEHNIDDIISILEEIIDNYFALDVHAFCIDEEDYERKKQELQFLKNKNDRLAQEARRLNGKNLQDDNEEER